jgi:type I restriction enzyme S subunit
MSFPRYPKYKDSGVDWLGEMPEHWQTLRLSILCDFQQGKAHEPFVDDDGDFICVNSRFVSTEGVTRKYCTENLTPAKKHDILMVMSDLPNGRALAKAYYVSDDEPYAVNQRVCKLTAKEAHPRFLFYQLSRNPQFLRNDDGSNQTHLSNADFTKFPTLTPPIAEQTSIAEFLDRETGKIDALVAEQQRLMALLKEKRQAVISQAVTKGLNLKAPMKPSGIEWLGDVPAHWEMTRLGWICSEINDINHDMPDAVETGVPFLSAKDLLNDGTLNFTEDIKMISEADFTKLSKKICPRRGDIIYSRIGACLGKARLVETDERFLISYSCCVVRVLEAKAASQFIQHLLDGEMILTEARMRTQGIGVPDLGLREIGRFPVPLPPMQEQEDIAVYLDQEALKFDTLTAEAQRAIDLLQERRTALISAAVTGQIDVRQT